jgi:D-arginine dehydrogenase
MRVRNVRRKWAGLRCFAQDRSPVVGYDTVQPGFFWLAALGGYGIQTAPALSRLAARMVLDLDTRPIAEPCGIDTSLLIPSRQF